MICSILELNIDNIRHDRSIMYVMSGSLGNMNRMNPNSS